DIQYNPHYTKEALVSNIDNAKLSSDFTNTTNIVDNHNGGALFVSKNNNTSFQGAPIRHSLFNKNSIKTQAITSIIKSNSLNKFYVGTEDSGIFEITLEELARIISGECQYQSSMLLTRLDNHDEIIKTIENKDVNDAVNLF